MTMEVKVRERPPEVDRPEKADKIVEAFRFAGPWNLTDLGNAERMIVQHGRSLRYCYKWRKWLAWDGKKWAIDDTGEAERRAKLTVRTIYREAESLEGSEERKKAAGWAVRSESDARIKAMLSLAQSEPGIPVRPEELDKDLYFLNVKNGTLNLRTGELQDHDRENLITKIVPVEYDPEAEAPRWMDFLDRIMAGNENLIGFLRRAAGYSLTGDVSERALFFLHGTGANGKSTFIGTLLDMMGDYGKQAEPELLLKKAPGAHTTGLADLAGARLVACLEVQEGRQMAEAVVKQMTGGADRMKARFMRGDFFEFSPTHKIFLAANHKPPIKETTSAIWDRVKLIPFEVTIPEEEQDKHLVEKLREELPGILAWSVKGCLEWQSDGLGIPEEVRAATSSYREEMDPIGPFISERCIVDPSSTVRAGELYKAYREWAEESGEKTTDNRTFAVKIMEHGIERGEDSKGRFYRLKLRA